MVVRSLKLEIKLRKTTLARPLVLFLPFPNLEWRFVPRTPIQFCHLQKEAHMESQIIAWITDNGMEGLHILEVLFSMMVAILFIQSGVDKLLNWKGELDYYKEHFKDSPLKGAVPLLMPIITVSELLAGFLSLIGIFAMVAWENMDFSLLGMVFACLSIVQLFFGQRLAKDYAGAATLVPYFILCAFGLLLFVIEAG